MTEHNQEVEENEAGVQIESVKDFQQMGLDSRILEVSILILKLI